MERKIKTTTDICIRGEKEEEEEKPTINMDWKSISNKSTGKHERRGGKRVTQAPRTADHTSLQPHIIRS